MTLHIKSEHVNTQKGVPISCIGVAQVKIESRNDKMLATACMHFLGKGEDEIRNIALETMEGQYLKKSSRKKNFLRSSESNHGYHDS